MDLTEVFKDSDDLVEFSAGDVILAEGDQGNHMYVVMEGELSVVLKDRVIAKAGVGDIVGEMALINSEIRSATVKADTDCILAHIDQSSFDSLLKYVPDFTMHVMNVLAGRLSSAYELIEN
jgi:CRP-like cAMP-binding protein